MPKKNGWIIKCLVCNKKVYITPCRKKQLYCSQKCANKSEKKKRAAINNLKSINNLRANNPRYKDGRWTYRKYTLLENANICNICKAKEKILVHHVDGNRGNNKKENLIILCYSCHNIIHKFSPKTQSQKDKIIKYSNILK